MRLSDLSGGRQAQLRTMPPLHETFDLLALEGLQEELLFYQDLLASNKRETRLSCALIERVMQLDRDVNANHPSSEDAQHKHTLIKTEVERMRTEVLTTLKNLAHSLAMLRGISDEHIRLFDIKEDPALTTSPPLNSVEYKQRRERILAKSKSLQNEWIALGTLARDLRDSITPYLTESERTPGK